MSSKPSRKQSMAACLLCCHEIDNVKRFHTVGACGHTGCCSLCALRMRQLLGTTSCVMCKTDLPRVICVESESESFHSFQDWGDNIGPTHVFDEASGMFFLKADFPNLHKLRDPVCKKCGKNFATVTALKTHLMDVHQLQHCGICLEHKKVFLGEQELYTKDQLKRHNTKGNLKEGFSGHPRCDFCFSRFYSTTELYDHLHKNHFECDICLHSMNIQNRYYKDYNDLENHFRAEHFLCEEPICLRKKFVVFKSHLDLQAHMTKEHPHIKVSRKIDVHFTVRRATHDGAGATNGDDGFEDYEQFQRQQQQYGNSNDRNIINVADFPSLSSGGGSGGSLFWENQTTTRPRMEDFPELASGSASGNGSAHASASFRNALAPPPTPAMLAHMNRGDAWEYPELASAAAALGANNPLMRFVKPSKMKGKKGKKSGGNGTVNGNGAVQAAAAANEDESKSTELEDDEEEEKAPTGPEQSKSAIVLKLRQVLGSDAKYEVFREDCKAFRMAEADIPTFYAKMKALFSAEDFDKLFLKLMRLFPDKEQVDKFFAFHKQFTKRQNVSQGFKESHSKKNKQQQNASQKKPVGAAPMNTRRQQQPQAAAASGWANALRETGAAPSARPNGRGPAVIVHNTDTRDILGRNEPPKTSWRSTHNWQAPVSSAAASTSTAASAGLTPASTKIQTAPVDSFASLSVGTAPSGVGPSYVTATAKPSTQQPPSFKKNTSDFPGLPTANRPIGVQPVTRATWDDQFQTIAQNRAPAQAPQSGGKKKQKKKSMTLAEMAVKFS
uniref:C2H2-type domain-containing protein n=1 Tax=Globisporangium ultimum (strain ATCC 200006 / CBS 805.95 / DAOM BR144) TaxID=431595 RepID=K3W8I5_GLOUD